MAIGSDPEIGTKFTTGRLTPEEQALWSEYMRTVWGPDLLGGYGKLCYPPGREPQ